MPTAASASSFGSPRSLCWIGCGAVCISCDAFVSGQMCSQLRESWRWSGAAVRVSFETAPSFLNQNTKTHDSVSASVQDWLRLGLH
jgi:hypothetical protein